MKKVLYTKFNSLRKTEFQIKTSIVEDETGRYVIKETMNMSSVPHLKCMKKNYDLLQNAYNNILVIPYSEDNEKLKFEYKKGKNLLDGIDYLNDDLDEIINKIKAALNIILDINDEYIEDFKMSEGFEKLFVDCKPINEKAYKVANIDSIFSNFVEVDGQVWCIDYEWVYNFDIPVNYIVFRTLLLLYQEKAEMLKYKITLEDYLYKFGLGEESLELYKKMEDCFQQHVHGENWKYIYIKNFAKKTTTLEDVLDENKRLDNELILKEQHVNNLTNEIRLKEQHINNLNDVIESQTNYINKLKKSIKNPVYGLVQVTKKLFNKRKNID